MKQFVKNRLLDALIKTILTYVAIHIATMTTHVILTGDLATLNGFRVLGFTLFFPGIDVGVGSFIVSIILYGAIFGAVYLILTKKS